MKKLSLSRKRFLAKKARRGNRPKARIRHDKFWDDNRQALIDFRYNRIYSMIFGHGMGDVR